MHSAVFERKTIIPVLVGAGLCLFFPRSGILSFFFLVPLAVLSFRYGYRSAWSALLLAVMGNTLLAFGTMLVQGNPLKRIAWDLLYFTIMASIFTWITSPLPLFSLKMSGGARFIAGSCTGALLYTGIFFRLLASPGFSENLDSLLSIMVSSNISSGSNVVEAALLESINTEDVLNAIKAIMLRGGSLVSCVLQFFVCRQIGLALARFSLRKTSSPEIHSRGTRSLVLFHANPVVIWVLSVSLLLVVLASMMKLEIAEIILWNILILCGILYLAQGLGILQVFLARPAVPPFLRFLLSVLFIALIFSPVINVVLLGGVVLLGIAENWVPFRAPKPNGPPSTPEAKDGGN